MIIWGFACLFAEFVVFDIYEIMNNTLFVCHGSLPDSRELAALVGQNGANHIMVLYLLD